MVAKRVQKKPVVKAKRIIRSDRVNRLTLRSALVSEMKRSTGRTDIAFGDASKNAKKSSGTIPIEERAGFPVSLRQGGVHPKNWKTHGGVKILVDFSRAKWLPDDWGQGVKPTVATAHTTGTGGGSLTTFVAPDGKSFFHKQTSEAYNGKGELTVLDGWNGQVRLAKLQAKQAMQLARAEGENKGLASDERLFKVLTPAERKCVPKKEELHIGVVSARRATALEGVRDIFMVQLQCEEAGVIPTWYVDEASLKDYKALGLKAVVGGKLTASRNKALADARKEGKVCVQVSDDIMAWEYRDGPDAKEKTDDALNAAWANAKRLVVSPVAAARFIVAKMRGCEAPKPKLGGVYMLGSCSRTFGSAAFARQHFVLGDFFVVEPDSTVKFDIEMKLKEDYDFTAGHITKYGSVMRCNRMTLNVKHYSNTGGACTNRDKKGEEERRNIAILQGKWPGCFRAHPTRKNEVILSWKKGAKQAFDNDDHDDEEVVNIATKQVMTKAKQTKVTKRKNIGMVKKKVKAKSS